MKPRKKQSKPKPKKQVLDDSHSHFESEEVAGLSGLDLSDKSADSEESGEDIMENVEKDYKKIPELDVYEHEGVDDEQYPDLGIEERKKADEEVDQRHQKKFEKAFGSRVPLALLKEEYLDDQEDEGEELWRRLRDQKMKFTEGIEVTVEEYKDT